MESAMTVGIGKPRVRPRPGFSLLLGKGHQLGLVPCPLLNWEESGQKGPWQ